MRSMHGTNSSAGIWRSSARCSVRPTSRILTEQLPCDKISERRKSVSSRFVSSVPTRRTVGLSMVSQHSHIVQRDSEGIYGSRPHSELSLHDEGGSCSFFMYHRRNLDASQPSGSRDSAPPLLRPAQAWLRLGSGLAQAWLSFGSGLLTLFTRRGAVKTHLTRNRQLLTRGPKDVPSSQARGPESVTTTYFITTLTDKET
jgi:hypothetical protein